MACTRSRTKQDFKTWDNSLVEKIHLKFCFLEVNNKASNLAINQKIMKYFVYLNNKENDSIVKQSFLMSKHLHSTNNSGFYSNFMSMLEKYYLSDLNPENFSNETIRQIETNMRNKYICFWQHNLEHSKKLEFYKVFKNEYSSSSYLTHLRNFPDRRNLVKFKISNHKLRIEAGRYQKDQHPRELILCRLCQSNQVGNETHFLFQYSSYSLQRQTFWKDISEMIPDIQRKSTSDIVKLLLNSKDYNVNKLVMMFICSCIIIRDRLLLNVNDVT